MELTKHEQLAAFDQYRELLFERMVQEIVDNREVILDIARERVELLPIIDDGGRTFSIYQDEEIVA